MIPPASGAASAAGPDSEAIEAKERLTSRLRAGVAFPDWSVVTSAFARAALVAMLEAAWDRRAWQDHTPEEDAVRCAILELYRDLGRAPSPEEIARCSNTVPEQVRSLLKRLAVRDLIVLDGDKITGAYPLTDRPSEHRIILGGRSLNALCAVDALGAGDMYGRDVEISSRCRACDAPITIVTGDRGRAVAHAQRESVVVWSGIRQTDGCAADSICTITAFFCDDAHLAAWRGEHHPGTPGFRLSIEEALQVGRAIFGPSLAGLESTP